VVIWRAQLAGSSMTGPLRAAVRRVARARIVPGIKTPFLERRPELKEEWHPTRNAGLAPDVLGASSGREAWWRCSGCGHEWQATISSRALSGTGCPRCYRQQNLHRLREASQRRSRRPARSLAAQRPELLSELHPTRNGDVAVLARFVLALVSKRKSRTSLAGSRNGPNAEAR